MSTYDKRVGYRALGGVDPRGLGPCAFVDSVDTGFASVLTYRSSMYTSGADRHHDVDWINSADVYWDTLAY